MIPNQNPNSLPQNNQPFNYKYLLISLMVIKYTWQQYINFRQIRRNLIRQKPQQLQKYHISDAKFLLSQSYSFDKVAFQMLALSIRMAVGCLSIMCNILPFIWNNVDSILPFINMDSQFERAVGFVLIQAFKFKAFEVPISVYQIFVIEKKYNFTNKTFSLFVYDLIVEAGLTLIIFPTMIYGYLQVVQIGGEYFYISLQIFALIITILFTFIHPNFIEPLFTKFTKMKDSHLKMKIFTLAHQKRIKLSNIMIMHSSARSSHSNAYFYGFGTEKTIVLNDNLLVNLTESEILGVVAHQMGHCYSMHSIQKLFIYLIEVISMFYIFALFTKNETVFESFGFTQKSAFIGVMLFFQLFEPLTDTFNTILLVVTRKFQFEADSFACTLGMGRQLKQSLIKLFEESTSTVRPDKVYAWLKHSHPTIYERIDNIERQIRTLQKKNGIFQQQQQDITEENQNSDSYSYSFSDSGLSI